LGGCFLWAVFYYKRSLNSWATFFHGKSYVLVLAKHCSDTY
jgi:hypothetical protein